MYNLFFKSTLSLLFLMLINPLYVNAQADTVIQTTWLQGGVQYRYGSSSWQPVSIGTAFVLPVEIITNDNSAVTLTQGATSLSLRENSHVELSNTGMRSVKLIDRVMQWMGSILYEVESNGDDFTVETPFLAATVKGTRFVVVSSDTNSIVTLDEGLLEVLDFDTGQSELMQPGDVIGAMQMAAVIPNNANVNAQQNRGLAKLQSDSSPLTVGQESEPETITSASTSNPVATRAQQLGNDGDLHGRDFGA